MSLNPAQMAATRRELAANFALTGMTKEEVASALNISETKLDHLFTLTQTSLNDPWILRNYLLEQVAAQGKTPVPFSALRGDWHQYWLLDADAIDEKRMSPGED